MYGQTSPAENHHGCFLSSEGLLAAFILQIQRDGLQCCRGHEVKVHECVMNKSSAAYRLSELCLYTSSHDPLVTRHPARHQEKAVKAALCERRRRPRRRGESLKLIEGEKASLEGTS